MGEGALRWLETEPDVLAFVRGDGLVCAVNFGTAPAPAPVPGTPLLASGPCPDGVLPVPRPPGGSTTPETRSLHTPESPPNALLNISERF
ncbi:DUF3459 domain-containing protein [Streptomyces sp. INA 01156]